MMWRPFAVGALWLLMAMPAALAQQATGPNPTASSVTEEQLFREVDRIRGRTTSPNPQLSMLVQPQGRDYRQFHEVWLPWIGGVAILLMVVALAGFYLVKGRVRIADHDKSRRKILRFSAFERFTHWMVATSFIVLAITGLNYVFGKRLLMPLLGADSFAQWSQWAKYAHNFISWPFMLGIAVMFVLWVRDNLPDRHDGAWLRSLGGFFGGAPPDAGRFNAGQKAIFWIVTIGGLLMSASGIVMLFPFALVDLGGMQIAQYVHSIVGMLYIAAILAHIYIGSIGMEGAISAMSSGEVDLAWARHHHRIWVQDRLAHRTFEEGPAAEPPSRSAA